MDEIDELLVQNNVRRKDSHPKSTKTEVLSSPPLSLFHQETDYNTKVQY